MDISKYPVIIVDGEPKLLGETEDFRLYECTLPEGGVGILKIAATAEKNPILDREAFLLQTMRSEAERLEVEYTKVKKNPEHMLNYQILFPNLVESFIAEDQGDRRVNILNFINVEDDIGRLVPIEHITLRDRVRVDPKTSAWMMGKLLKLLVFAHSQNISVCNITGQNILIERKEHYVVVFDWSEAAIYSGGIPQRVVSDDIAHAAKEVIVVLGGDPRTGKIPADPQLVDDRYQSFLYELANGRNSSDASIAHGSFYALVRSMWPRKYWPFTSYPL